MSLAISSLVKHYEERPNIHDSRLTITLTEGRNSHFLRGHSIPGRIIVMKFMKTPTIFISHRWADNDFYEDVVHLFEKQDFCIRDYSCPKDKPLNENEFGGISAAIKKRIKESDVFLVFIHHEMKESFWCQFEIDFASQLKKPKLGIVPKRYEEGDESKAFFLDLLLTIPDLINGESSINHVAESLILKIQLLMFVNSFK